MFFLLCIPLAPLFPVASSLTAKQIKSLVVRGLVPSSGEGSQAQGSEEGLSLGKAGRAQFDEQREIGAFPSTSS